MMDDRSGMAVRDPRPGDTVALTDGHQDVQFIVLKAKDHSLHEFSRPHYAECGRLHSYKTFAKPRNISSLL
jgi:hypothetical protein